jgi:hypothetical protein
VRFPRSVVFMFDRSGSMTGDPIRYAKAALLNGLHMLGPEDKFTVVAFDHEQLWWTGKHIAVGCGGLLVYPRDELMCPWGLFAVSLVLLHMLGPEDKLTVVAFDHERLWWTGGDMSMCLTTSSWRKQVLILLLVLGTC